MPPITMARTAAEASQRVRLDAFPRVETRAIEIAPEGALTIDQLIEAPRGLPKRSSKS
jgi:hypothetical protein